MLDRTWPPSSEEMQSSVKARVAADMTAANCIECPVFPSIASMMTLLGKTSRSALRRRVLGRMKEDPEIP